MEFADIHNHMLFGCDDGADDENVMKAMIDRQYGEGVRTICFTPHYHPGFFGDNISSSNAAFEKAKEYASAAHPDLKLYIGNELRYDKACLRWLEQGKCRTMNGTNYVLVDFLYGESADNIMNGVLQILNYGYTPILAHAERYEKFHSDFREILRLKDCGVVIQVDTQSPLGGLGRGSKKRARLILKHYLADIVCSDGHDLGDRPPDLKECCDYVAEQCGGGYAEYLFNINPLRILNDLEVGKE